MVKDARYLLLGITFKENCPDIRNTKVVDIYHTLSQYSSDITVYDAHQAGFDTVVIIIKEAIKKDFMETVGKRLEKAPVEIRYAYQELDKLPAGITIPEGRTKPWGTGQAVLACKGILQEPFAVINADDYYGKEAFVKLHDFLQGYSPDAPGALSMAGFVLKNPLCSKAQLCKMPLLAPWHL